MFMKKYFSMVAVFMLATFGTSIASAEVKIGYVNWGVLLAKSKPAKEANARIKKEFLPRQARFKAKVKKHKSLQVRLGRDSKIMSKSQVLKIQREIRSLQRDIKRSNVELREDFTLRHNEERAKIYKKLKAAIASYAAKEKYDLVIHLGVLHYSKKIDITGKVLAVLAKK